MRVVTDTSPLYYLSVLGQLTLLERLYGRVVVPRAVANELEVGRQEGYEVPDIAAHAWLVVESVPAPALLGLVVALGPGEVEALALATLQPTDLVLLDDAPARELAASRGLRCTGTLGVLLAAKSEGLLREVMPCVERLRRAGFRMTDDLAATVARLAGEKCPSRGETPPKRPRKR